MTLATNPPNAVTPTFQSASARAPSRKSFVVSKDRPGHDRRYAIDFSKIKNELGWMPKHNLEAGLKATVSWFLTNTAWVENVRTGGYREWIEKNYGNR